MKTNAFPALFLFALSLSFLASCDNKGKELPPEEKETTYNNPVSDLILPDPSVIRDSDGTFYLYASDESVKGLPIVKSKDLVNWSQSGQVFSGAARPRLDGSSDGNLWAPEIARIGNKYVLYYSYTPKDFSGKEWQWGIGAATADRPTGPWTDKGKIFLDGEEIQNKKESEFRKKRHMIQMAFQNPFDCLDPVRHVKSLLEEPLKLWKPELSASDRLERIHGVISECGLPENSLGKFPREFSGGQLQRISIARALLIEPKILIADEIISALDVSVQNQILNLLLKMKAKHDLSILFITHDLSVARKVSDRVMVMREGVIKGIGTPEEVFASNTDPYILELASAVFTFKGQAVNT